MYPATPLIVPAPRLCLPPNWLQQRQDGGRVALGQRDLGLADRKRVALGQLRGRRQLALLEQRQHLFGGNLREQMDEVVLADELIDSG